MTAAANWSLRTAADADRGFLFLLYCTTMRDVVERTWGWDEASQRTDFDRRFSAYSTWVIESAGTPIGHLCIERTAPSIYIHELQIVPLFQGRGIGTAVIEDLIAQAANDAIAVELSVVAANPAAKRLYERLGFRVSATQPPFMRMRYRR